MGNLTSKLFSHDDDENKSKIQGEKIEKNEICTPKMDRKISGDPRSASCGITRTPIEIISTPTGPTRRVATAIPKYLQVKQYLETDLDKILPAVTPEKRILDPRSPNVAHQRTPIMVKQGNGYLTPIVLINEGPDTITPENLDPRSPATNFDRTPILKQKISEFTDQQNYELKNENLKIKMYCETTGDFDIPEIQTLPKIISEESENSHENQKIIDEELHFENSEESEDEDQITVIHNPKIFNKSQENKENLTLSEISEEKIDEKLIIENSSNIEINKKTEDPNEKGKIRVWRDSSSHLSIDELKKEKSNNSEEIMIEFDDEIILNKQKIEISNTQNDKLKLQSINKSVKKHQIVKKDVKGIFEDGKNENGKNRAPLSNRSNNNKSEIPSKSPQQILRNKNLLTNPAQENTPPNSKRFRSKTRNNGSHWDPDMTVII